MASGEKRRRSQTAMGSAASVASPSPKPANGHAKANGDGHWQKVEMRVSGSNVCVELAKGNVLETGEGTASLLANFSATRRLKLEGLTKQIADAGGGSVAEELGRWLRDMGPVEVGETLAETSAGRLPFAKALHLLTPEFADYCCGSEEVGETLADTSAGRLPFAKALHLLTPEFADYCCGSEEVGETLAETSAGRLPFAKALHLFTPEFADYCCGSDEVGETLAETSAGRLPFAKALHLLTPEFADYCCGSEEVGRDALAVSLNLVLEKAESSAATLVALTVPRNGLPTHVVATAFVKCLKELGQAKSVRTLRIVDLSEAPLEKLRDVLAMDGATSWGRPKAADEEENCSVCMCPLQDPDEEVKELEKCGHTFHAACIREAFEKMQKKCPICGTWYGVPLGNQPAGQMSVVRQAGTVPGFPRNSGVLQITYHLQGGTQGPEHPRPGVPFSGTMRIGYLPDTAEGRVVADLLRLAWEYKLVFTVGDSHTSGQQNTTVWNCIHHKTSLNGGPQNYGYPDDTYLQRVEMELAAQGVTRELLGKGADGKAAASPASSKAGKSSSRKSSSKKSS